MSKQTEYNKIWQTKNKERTKYLHYRSMAKSFISKFADIEDLDLMKDMIDQRIAESYEEVEKKSIKNL